MLRPTRLTAARALAGAVAAALTLSACQVASEPQGEPDPDVTQVGSTQTPDGEDEFVYVAMGDSYTAAPLFPLAEQEQINGCLRSDQNYPALVASQLDVPLIDVSCSGASTTSMFAAQRFIDNERPPQLDSLTSDTDLVTLGIGANDFRYFSKMIFTCLKVAKRDPEGSPCRDKNLTPKGRDRIERHLGEIRRNVSRVVRTIGRKAPNAQILLVGYPQLLPAEGTCRNKLPLAVGDYAYTRDLNLRLSNAVRKGGVKAGAEFVDLVEASQGHDICSKEPWVAGIRGAPKRAMGLHPYPAEQQAVADLLVAMI
ncbi:SGNH/GDSL hydrolase family protein [Nocardioides sp.]|uniref:SGNH/GDSL hydrolase family protein n=1 Tax=Nocardioides sp. TaxID=35761 RepID=UPI00321947A4